MSNLEVAQYLLQHGLEGLDGVLFLNERNERVDLAGATATWDHLGSLGIWIPIGSMVLLYMGTFTINIPPMLAYIPYMDPMGYGRRCWSATA